MKKIQSLSMLCAITVLFVACGGGSSTPVSKAEEGVLSVSIGTDKTANPNERVVLTSTVKNNSGAIKSYSWKEGNKELGKTRGLIYRSSTSGVHTIALTIVDSANKTATDSVKITITSAPSVNISAPASGNNIKVGESVTLNTSVENSGAGAVTYQWFINGQPVSDQTGSTFTHQFTTAGSYTVSVEIKDSDGKIIATNSEVITVLSDTNANGNTNSNGNANSNGTNNSNDNNNTNGNSNSNDSNNSNGNTNDSNNTIDSLTQGLKAWYQFEDNANDSSGNGNHGEVFGNVTYVDSTLGKGAKFDGNSSIILVQSETLKSFNDKFTLSFWTKYHYTEEGAKNAVVHITNGLDVPLNGEAGFYNYSDKNGIDFRVGAWEDTNTSSVKLPYDAVQTLDGQTEHLITFVVDGNSTSIYKDAVIEKTGTKDNTYSISRPSSNWYIGSMGDVYHLDGIIDDMRLYNRVLTGDEVQKLYDLKN